MRPVVMMLVAAAVLAGCATGYTLVSPGTVAVSRGAMQVRPTTAWNRVPRGAHALAVEEEWTLNGPLLDALTFIGGLKDGEAITRQRAKDDRKVPVFRAAMTPQDLVSMVESYYRIRGGATVFETLGVRPGTLGGLPAVQFDFGYLAADELRRRGRSVIAVKDARLYMISLEAAALHYFDAALPQFDSLVASVTL